MIIISKIKIFPEVKLNRYFLNNETINKKIIKLIKCGPILLNKEISNNTPYMKTIK
tara:strand:+ start:490 stop:657 length:168 start_codon:yes stop_codon:yes gene_type:complete